MTGALLGVVALGLLAGGGIIVLDSLIIRNLRRQRQRAQPDEKRP